MFINFVIVNIKLKYNEGLDDRDYRIQNTWRNVQIKGRENMSQNRIENIGVKFDLYRIMDTLDKE